MAAQVAGIDVEFVPSLGRSSVTRHVNCYPLKFICCQNDDEADGGRQKDCARVTVLSYGGGVLGGDRTEAVMNVGPGATALFGTQGTTKVYKQGRGGLSAQAARLRVGAGGLALLLPHPVTAFRDALYDQRQEFHVDGGGSLVLLDWITSGRMERGERWAFRRVTSTNTVHVAGQLRLRDALKLENPSLPAEGSAPAEPATAVAARMRGHQIAGLLVACGERCSAVAQHLMASQRRDAFDDVERKRRTAAGSRAPPAARPRAARRPGTPGAAEGCSSPPASSQAAATTRRAGAFATAGGRGRAASTCCASRRRPPSSPTASWSTRSRRCATRSDARPSRTRASDPQGARRRPAGAARRCMPREDSVFVCSPSRLPIFPISVLSLPFPPFSSCSPPFISPFLRRQCRRNETNTLRRSPRRARPPPASSLTGPCAGS